jgi:hypothetical protein
MKQRSLFDYIEEPSTPNVAPISPPKPRRSKADTTLSFSEAKRIKKNNGRYYTPVNIVKQILDLSEYFGPRILRKHIMENSCGDGAFLCEIVERYCQESANSQKSELKTELETFVHGIELDPTEREKCVRNLDAVALKYGVSKINWDVICADALTVDQFDGQMDFVVGNPPYVRVHNLGASFDAVKKFELAQDGMTDLFIVFYEIGLRMLNHNGVLGYITPSSFFNSVAGARLRQKIVADNLLVKLAAVIHDAVTTTDELIPSGETSSYRSNPLRLAEFALSRRVPEYVGRSKAVAATEAARRNGGDVSELQNILSKVGNADELIKNTQFGSCVFANKPGDGSAREQAASCQKVLGGFANICYEFATKRYRSNCINWGILPFTLAENAPFPYECGDYVFVEGIREKIARGDEEFAAKVIKADGSVEDITLYVKGLTDDEKEIILDGCLMNYYKNHSN